MDDIIRIAEKFDIQGKIVSVKPLGNGLINETFKVETSECAPDYVLQRINNSIFQDVDMLQHNIEAVTGHIRQKLLKQGTSDIDRKVLRYICPKGSDKTYLLDNGKYWRMSVFIPDAITCETVNPEYSYYAGKAFGNFEAMLADIPEELGETIPDFHNMELRLRQLREAVENNKAGRLDSPEVKAILEDLDKYAEQMCKAERLHREGKLPKRICHCDTKVNNMMFDKNGEVLCVIDLDTVMPSYIFSDFGDFLRTGANTVAEDDPDIAKVEFRMDIFESFTKGYLESVSSFITPVEKENLPYGALMFPYMQAVRFFADYLNGDTYYKTKYPEHNLVRTRNQLALFHSGMAHEDEMRKIIDAYGA